MDSAFLHAIVCLLLIGGSVKQMDCMTNKESSICRALHVHNVLGHKLLVYCLALFEV